ncbi:MAG: class I SAM-dependent methyltransferase [Bryobacteraceae bacterium]
MKKTILAAMAAVALAAVSMPVWKPYARRSKWFVVATNIYSDTLRRTGLKKGQFGDNTGGALRNLAEVARIHDVFGNYLKHGITAEVFGGRDVLEVGPGDNVGVPLRFVAAGARRAVCVDRFIPFQTSPFHLDLYRTLRSQIAPAELSAFDSAIQLDGGVRLDPARLEHVYGKGIEDAALPEHSFSLIISNAVLEEVYDTDRAFATMDRLLAPGGTMAHKIDFKDYGMFSNFGFHALEFLTIPDWVYRYMSESVGQPNRRLIDYYREKMRQLGYQPTLYITSVYTPAGERPLPPGVTRLEKGVHYGDDSVAYIGQIRPRLLDRYRGLADEDLIASGIMLVAQKPK